MSVRRSFDDRLEAWLDEGPDAAPRELLASVLETCPATAQRRRVLPWRMQMPTIARYAVLVAVLAIAGVLGATLFAGGGAAPAPAPAATPGPTATIAASPAPSAAQAGSVAADFVLPFTYRLDPASGLEVSADAQLYQFRHASADGQHDVGVIVRPAPEIQTSAWCSPGGPAERDPSPARVLEILRQLPVLQWHDNPGLMIDGRAADGITAVQVKAKGCPDAYVWPGDGSFTGNLPYGGVRRVQPIDVGGKTVLVITTGNTQSLFDGFLPTAGAFISTLHWPQAAASPAP